MYELKRILVPLDGSSLAEKALPPAIALAQKFGGELYLVRAVDIPNPISVASDIAPSAALLEAREQAKDEADRYLQACQDNLHQQGFETHTRLYDDTSPADDIIAAATEEKIDLIVMSTHGRSGLARWAFGSVADKVVRHGPCPVLLIRQSKE